MTAIGTAPERLCYYATAVELAAGDDRTLAAVHRMCQPAGGATVVAVQTMFHVAGLPAVVARCADITAVRATVAAAGSDRGGIRERFAVAFVRGNGSGHMVIADYDARTGEVRFRDYQADRSGPDATDDIVAGAHFFVFR